jgi:site-specific recombinase XerD
MTASGLGRVKTLRRGRYTSAAIAWLLVDILRRAELKPQDGRTGPRLHDLRHSMAIGTRNCRLAAIRSFFNFVAGKEPTYIAQCAEILTVPIKRAPIPAPCYLELREVEAILAQPDRSTLEGMRDHALLSFLYNSGARIQEALDLCTEAIRFESPSCVRLHGKGRKERICPLWPETVMLLNKLLERQPRAPTERVFVNRYGEPLGASGVRFKLAAYVEAAAKTVPTLRSKHVTPHRFRHATAVHLVSAGVDITVIRSWLGHVSLARRTTTRRPISKRSERRWSASAHPQQVASRRRGNGMRAYSPGSTRSEIM